VNRAHRILFALIALLAFATFVFGVLQFVAMRDHQPPDRSPLRVSDTNAAPHPSR
jgi:hypothetical protein